MSWFDIDHHSNRKIGYSYSNELNKVSSDQFGKWQEDDMDTIQIVLDAAGLIPVIGFIPDIANGVIFIARGRYAEAGLSLIASVPGIGLISSGSKYVYKTVKVVGRKGGVKFFKNSKAFSTLRKEYSKAYKWTTRTKNRRKTESLDHWLIPQKFNKWVQQQDYVPLSIKQFVKELHNGGWNLVELPGSNPFHKTLSLNDWMGLVPNWKGKSKMLTRILAKSVRNVYTISIPISLINPLAKGYRYGEYQEKHETFEKKIKIP